MCGSSFTLSGESGGNVVCSSGDATNDALSPLLTPRVCEMSATCSTQSPPSITAWRDGWLGCTDCRVIANRSRTIVEELQYWDIDPKTRIPSTV